jgi:hypothetical protein
MQKIVNANNPDRDFFYIHPRMRIPLRVLVGGMINRIRYMENGVEKTGYEMPEYVYKKFAEFMAGGS